jgi:alkaline phosphatase D
VTDHPAVSRRRLLAYGGALAGLTALPGLVGCTSNAVPAITRTRIGGTPFTLGVASGDPTADGAVLWTRLAPDPLAPDGLGGMPPQAVPVQWEVAIDPDMRTIVQQGEVQALPGDAHAVHVELAGLLPARDYWYRFRTNGEASIVGRTRTAPAPGTRLDRMRFAFVSCSHYETGFFSAYRHVAEENPDLILFLGDYFYEYAFTKPEHQYRRVRKYNREDLIVDLPGYRTRYAIHTLDPDLQALHAAAPILATWDDHEVENDYSGVHSQRMDVTTEQFLRTRADAYRAFFENMPIRRSKKPRGSDARIYDRLRYGDLAEIHLLDGRQYRSRTACVTPDDGGGHLEFANTCAELNDPARTVLGFEQERWLHQGLKQGTARWNLIAQDQLFARFDQHEIDKDKKDTGRIGNWTDGWDGYPVARQRVIDSIATSKARNPVILGGDIHSFWVNDIKRDFNKPNSPTVATEFVGTSITSNNPSQESFANSVPLNPHIKLMDAQRHGWVSVDLRRDHMDTRLMQISDRRDPKAPAWVFRRYEVEAGKAGAQPVGV